jgi:hypothetical protein
MFNDMKRMYATNIGLGYDQKKMTRLLELETKLRDNAAEALVNRPSSAMSPMGSGERFVQSVIKAGYPGAIAVKSNPEEAAIGTLEAIGIYQLPVGEGAQKQLEVISEGPELWSRAGWAEMTGTTIGIIPSFAATEIAALALKSPVMSIKGVARAAGAIERVMNSKRVGRIIYPALKEGAKYEATGMIFSANPLIEDEAAFSSGFLGSLAGQAIIGVAGQKYVSMAFKGVFGNKAADAIGATTRFGKTVRVAAELTGKGAGEVGQEYGEEMGSIYRQSDSWAEAKQLLEERFGTMSQNVEFMISTFVMGVGMGAPSAIGKIAFDTTKNTYETLYPEEK